MKYSIDVSGIKELKEALSEPLGLEAVKKSVQYHGGRVQRGAQRRARVDTGFMKRSIELHAENAGLTARITGYADYTYYHEHGTRKMSAQPMFAPSVREVESGFVADIKRIIE